jgi:hypothetical protein
MSLLIFRVPLGPDYLLMKNERHSHNRQTINPLDGILRLRQKALVSTRINSLTVTAPHPRLFLSISPFSLVG